MSCLEEIHNLIRVYNISCLLSVKWPSMRLSTSPAPSTHIAQRDSPLVLGANMPPHLVVFYFYCIICSSSQLLDEHANIHYQTPIKPEESSVKCLQ